MIYKPIWTSGWSFITPGEPNSGRYCFGKTPLQTFIDSKSLATDKALDKQFEKSLSRTITIIMIWERFSRFPYRPKEIR